MGQRVSNLQRCERIRIFCVNLHQYTSMTGRGQTSPKRAKNLQKSIGLHDAATEGSAASWTVVIDTFPDQRTVATVGSLNAPFAAAWHELRRGPGRYSLGLRHYHWSTDVELPAVTVDGVEAVQARTVRPDINYCNAHMSHMNCRGNVGTCL
jgi:hypothetical protein